MVSTFDATFTALEHLIHVGLNDAQHAWLANAYSAHSEAVFATCLRFAAGERAWALDRMQDVFVKAAEDMSAIRDQAALGGWLHRTAVNVCLMSLRRGRIWNRLRAAVGFTDYRYAAPADVGARAKGELTRLEGALQSLTANQRAVFVLANLEEQPQHVIADLLSLSKGQVSKLHAKALEALRAMDWDVGDG